MAAENYSQEKEQNQEGIKKYRFGGVHGHNDLSHLSLYYQQSLKSMLGRTGIVILGFFAFGLFLSFCALFMSYTSFGRAILQDLVFDIF